MATVQKIITKLGATVTLVEPADSRPYFRYEPNNPGTDTFTYKITQGTQTSSASVTVEVTDSGTVLIKANNDTYSTIQDQTITMTVLNNDIIDVNQSLIMDYYGLSVTPTSSKDGAGNLVKTITTPNLAATMRLIIPADGKSPYFTYTAKNAGRETISYIVKQLGQETIGTITIDVARQAIDVVANNDTYVMLQGESKTLNVLVNDSFDALLPIKISLPAQASTQTTETARAIITTGNTPLGNKVELVEQPDQLPYLRYTALNAGADSFKYSIAQDGKTSTATIGVNVKEVILEEPKFIYKRSLLQGISMPRGVDQKSDKVVVVDINQKKLSLYSNTGALLRQIGPTVGIYSFSNIQDVAFAANNAIYVSDRTAGVVYLVGQDGSFQSRIVVRKTYLEDPIIKDPIFIKDPILDPIYYTTKTLSDSTKSLSSTTSTSSLADTSKISYLEDPYKEIIDQPIDPIIKDPILIDPIYPIDPIIEDPIIKDPIINIGPIALCVDADGLLLVLDGSAGTATAYLGTTPKYSFGLGSGSGKAQFLNAEGIDCDTRIGNFYVADTGNHRIQKFSPAGVFIKSWGTLGNLNGQFRSPADVAVDGKGNVYVADSGNNRVQVFDEEGIFKYSFGGLGSANSQFNNPRGIAYDHTNNLLYISDLNNGRVQVFGAGTALFADTTRTAINVIEYADLDPTIRKI